MGVCAAWYNVRRTAGHKVNVFFSSCISLMSYQLSYYFCSGQVPGRLGSGHLSLIPYNSYKTKDGYITIGISWPRVARTLGLDWVIDDPRFDTREARWEHREELERIFSERLLDGTSEEWLKLMRDDDVAAGPVNTVDQAAADPQVKENHMVLNIEHPLGGEIKLAGNPIKMPGSIEEQYLPPPTMGQHNDEVLRGLLGYSERTVSRMKKQEQAHAAELQTHLHKLK